MSGESADAAAASGRRFRAMLGATGTALLFAGYFSVTRMGLGDQFTVGDLVAARYVVPAILLLPWALRIGGLGTGLAGIAWPRAIALSVFGGLSIVWFLTAGLQHAPPAQAGIYMSATVPLFVVLLAWVALKERPSGWQLFGIGLIFAGDALVAMKGFGDGGKGEWLGQIQFLAASVCWAVYTVLARKWQVDPIRATIATSVLSGFAFLPYYLIFMVSGLAAASALAIAVQSFYMGVLVGILAIVWFTAAIRELGAPSASIFLALVPAAATIMGIPFGDRPSPLEWAGVAIVTIGMPFALGWRPARRQAAG